MFFGGKKRKYEKKKESITKPKEIVDIPESEKGNSKIDNISDEIVAKAIKDLLAKD